MTDVEHPFMNLHDALDQAYSLACRRVEAAAAAYRTAEREAEIIATAINELSASHHWGLPETQPAADADPTSEPTPPAADDLTCPDCGQVCATANGLAIHRARKHKAPPKPKMPPLEDIAAAYKDADEAGRRPIAAIAGRWDVDRAVAQEWVNLTRAAGHLPPRDEPQVARTAPVAARPRAGTPTL